MSLRECVAAQLRNTHWRRVPLRARSYERGDEATFQLGNDHTRLCLRPRVGLSDAWRNALPVKRRARRCTESFHASRFRPDERTQPDKLEHRRGLTTVDSVDWRWRVRKRDGGAEPSRAERPSRAAASRILCACALHSCTSPLPIVHRVSQDGQEMSPSCRLWFCRAQSFGLIVSKSTDPCSMHCGNYIHLHVIYIYIHTCIHFC